MFGFNRKTQGWVGLKDHWRHMYRRDESDFHEILERESIWSNWDRSMLPESSAEHRFRDGLVILFGDGNAELAQRYVQRSLEVVARILHEDKLRSERCVARFPLNLGHLLRVQVFAESFLGEVWNNQLLLDASGHIEQACSEGYPDPSDWDSQVQYYFIEAVHLAFLGGDTDRANQLLSTPPYLLKDHTEYATLLRGLVTYSRGGITETDRSEFLASYRKFMDNARDPRVDRPKNWYMGITGPLEVVLLWEMYIAHPGEAIDWQRVVDTYSADIGTNTKAF